MKNPFLHKPVHDGRPGEPFNRYFTAEGGKVDAADDERIRMPDAHLMMRSRPRGTNGGGTPSDAGVVLFRWADRSFRIA